MKAPYMTGCFQSIMKIDFLPLEYNFKGSYFSVREKVHIFQQLFSKHNDIKPKF